MRKTVSLICFSLLSFSLLAVPPVSRDIGEVTIRVEEGSITETALSASSEPFTEEWLEKYTSSPYVFGEAYSEVLSAVLPLSNPVAGKERNSAVDIQDLDTGTVLSFVFADGRIAAVLPSDRAKGSES